MRIRESAWMTSEPYVYQGADLLRLGRSLPNYTRSIATLVVRYGRGATNVLDFGAGIGVLSEEVRALGLTPVCLEPDARQRDELAAHSFYTIASLDEVKEASLDYIYSSNVLEHIEDDVMVLAALRGKLKAGGRLLLYVPAFQSLFSSMDVAVGHWRRYDRQSLTQKFIAAGFAIDDVFYADVLGYLATSVFKAVGDKSTNVNERSLSTYDRFIFPVGRLIERFVRVPFGKNIVGVATNLQAG